MDRIQTPGNREVGANALGPDALVQSSPGDVEAEVLASVRRVQKHSPLLRLQQLRQYLAVLVQDAPRIAAEEVRDNISRFEERQKLMRDRRSVARDSVTDVDHEAHASLGGSLFRQLNHLHAHDGHAGADRSYLHALDERLVRLDDSDRFFEVDVLSTRKVRLVVQADAGDVQHADDSGLVLRHDELWEASE